MAPSTIADTVDIELGGQTVSVPKGGLFDRYRMNTDLDRVAADPRVPGVDFFRSLPKTAVESAIGPTLTPNFYYRMSKAQVTMLAPLRAIRTRLPADLEPLRAGPRSGLVSVVFFRYDVCDIDFYTEVAVAIAVRPPGRHGWRRSTRRRPWPSTAPTPMYCPCRSPPRSPGFAATTVTDSPSGQPISTLTSTTAA